MFERLIPFHAGQTPQAIALVRAGNSFSFSRMAADIGRCANWLAGLDLPPCGRALLHIPDPYVHWIVTLGLEQHGLVSADSAGALASDTARLRADVVFTSQAPDSPLAVPTHRIDQTWIDALPSQPDTWARAARPRPEDPCRIIVTSGTTGEPRKILLTRAMIDERIQNLIMTRMYSRPDLKVASTIGLGSVGGFLTRLRTWGEGGCIVELARWTDLIEGLTTQGINLLRLAPFHLQTLLRDLPDDIAPQPDLILGLMGGSISGPLAAETRRRLTGDIVVNYGATEVGTVAIGRLGVDGAIDAAAGFVCPWAEVEILDSAGAPLPHGAVGEIRIRSGDMSAGYLEDAQVTRAMFRDGWFWPGDLGAVSSSGLLTVVGRTNDLMNIGGAKFLASRLEAQALQVMGVLDAAAYLAPDDSGLDAPHLAYVAGPTLDLPALTRLLAHALKRDARLVPVEAIPRNAMGKIQRDLLPRATADQTTMRL